MPNPQQETQQRPPTQICPPEGCQVTLSCPTPRPGRCSRASFHPVSVGKPQFFHHSYPLGCQSAPPGTPRTWFGVWYEPYPYAAKAVWLCALKYVTAGGLYQELTKKPLEVSDQHTLL